MFATTFGGSDGSTSGETTATPTSSADSTAGGPSLFDVGGGTPGDDTEPTRPSCTVGGELDGMLPCTDVAPADSFDPDVQWTWAGGGNEDEIIATPVVANLTDDNADGAIDLCDIPDVVVLAYDGLGTPGHLYVLDGATGAQHLRIDTPMTSMSYPALGDLDGDAVPEIVTLTAAAQLAAFRHDGSLLWQSTHTWPASGMAIALADLDADGDVEIMLGGNVYDHEGTWLWQGEPSHLNTAADLDGDDDLEVISGRFAYHHDGSPYFTGPAEVSHPHVADLDLDGLPEVVFVGTQGITVVNHDGTAVTSNQAANLASWRPAAIHDMDGDGAPEIAVGAANNYSVLETNLVANWTAQVADESGYAAGTAFDFLGDGTAEAMYADETTLFIFGEDGTPLLTTPRRSWTQWENPVVVDVDNDGSAEIVVVSNDYFGDATSPPLQVIRDAQDRWVPARRIWNQHAYHVTNVREDGTIPVVQPKNWLTLNTFRTQAQIGQGGVCMPVPRG